MSDVKWIKISTDIFDNRKIKIIESMPEGDAITVIWFKLLCLAAASNDGGMIYITRDIPYTPETLAVILNRPITTVRLALKTFAELQMIEIHDDFITLPGWEEYQNTEGLERIREQGRLRAQLYRDRKKAARLEDKTAAAKKEDLPIYKEVIDYLNAKAGTGYRHTTKKTQTLIHARTKEGFTLDDFKAVIDGRCAKWKGTEYEQYIRPETLFGSKFEGYLNAKETIREINTPAKKTEISGEFEAMWASFPGHDNDSKEDAYEAYRDAITDGVTPAEIKDALTHYTTTPAAPHMSGRSFFGGGWKQHK